METLAGAALAGVIMGAIYNGYNRGRVDDSGNVLPISRIGTLSVNRNLKLQDVLSKQID